MKDLLDKLIMVYEKALPCLDTLTFNGNNQKHVYVLGSICSILENTKCCITLIKNGDHYSVPIILRSVIEAHADVVNLAKINGYQKRMDYTDICRSLALIKEIKKGDNPFTAGSDSSANKLEPILKEAKKQLRTQGIEELSIAERLRLADQKDVYESVYTILSSHSHNGITAMIDRYFSVEKGVVKISCFNDVTAKELRASIDSLGGSLYSAIEAGYEALEVERTPKLRALKEARIQLSEV